MYFKKPKQTILHEDKQPSESPSQSKLKDLITEIDLFVTGWKKQSARKTGYSRKITHKSITDDDCKKITDHSWNIQSKIKAVKDLGIKNADAITQQCTDEVVSKWIDRLGGVDLFTYDHCWKISEAQLID